MPAKAEPEKWVASRYAALKHNPPRRNGLQQSHRLGLSCESTTGGGLKMQIVNFNREAEPL